MAYDPNYPPEDEQEGMSPPEEEFGEGEGYGEEEQERRRGPDLGEIRRFYKQLEEARKAETAVARGAQAAARAGGTAARGAAAGGAGTGAAATGAGATGAGAAAGGAAAGAGGGAAAAAGGGGAIAAAAPVIGYILLVILIIIAIIIFIFAILVAGCYFFPEFMFLAGLSDFCERAGSAAGALGLPTPGGGGSCRVPAGTSLCSSQNLIQHGCRADRAEQMSIICNFESGFESGRANPTAWSRSDICLDENGGPRSHTFSPNFPVYGGRTLPLSVSWGLLQINLTAHDLGGEGCPRAFTAPYTGDNKRCALRGAEGARIYERCVARAIDVEQNLSFACNLFNTRGFSPWQCTAWRCGLAPKGNCPL